VNIVTVGQLAGIDLQRAQAGSGGAFLLRKPAAASSSVEVGGWTTTVLNGTKLVVTYSEQEAGIDEIFAVALMHANLGLDYMCALAMCDVVIFGAYNDALVWALRGSDVTMRATVITPMAMGLSASAQAFDAQGNEIPQVAPPPPPLHDAMRFMRMARTADSLFEAYRNMFLALESLLHHVYPQQSPGEGRWFKDALVHVDPTVPASILAPTGELDPIQWVYDNIYSDLRSGMMHAKTGYHLPGEEARRVDVEQSFNSLWRYTRDLMRDVLGTPNRGGRMSDYGLKALCEGYLGAVRLAVSDDKTPVSDADGAFAPAGGRIVELTPGGVTIPEPFLGVIDGTCDAAQVRALGSVNRIGTMGEDGETRTLSELPPDLAVGTSVTEFQVRAGVRYANADAIRSHFPM
jgi:hypothetical protein